MPNLDLYNIEGTPVGEIYLDDGVFGIEINKAVLYQVVKMQLANKRQGTQSALTRAEVRGGGRKPWRQKGTGRARHGSIRSPIWIKGGVAFAPKPRALSTKVANKEIIVLDSINLPEAKTKEMVKVLKNLNVGRKALIVLPGKDEVVQRAARNIPGVKLAYTNTLNVLDILNYGTFIVTQDAVRQIEEVYA